MALGKVKGENQNKTKTKTKTKKCEKQKPEIFVTQNSWVKASTSPLQSDEVQQQPHKVEVAHSTL
jgi:hypothetical protein